jgi:hypothetical protein
VALVDLFAQSQDEAQHRTTASLLKMEKAQVRVSVKSKRTFIVALNPKGADSSESLLSAPFDININFWIIIAATD